MKFFGVVQKGVQTGRTLGFATANIPLNDDSVSGVFAALVTVDGKKEKAVVFADKKRKILEAHLLDASGDLYGKEITIKLLEKIREPLEFKEEKEAKETIAADIAKARQII